MAVYMHPIILSRLEYQPKSGRARPCTHRQTPDITPFLARVFGHVKAYRHIPLLIRVLHMFYSQGILLFLVEEHLVCAIWYTNPMYAGVTLYLYLSLLTHVNRLFCMFQNPNSDLNPDHNPNNGCM